MVLLLLLPMAQAGLVALHSTAVIAVLLSNTSHKLSTNDLNLTSTAVSLRVLAVPPPAAAAAVLPALAGRGSTRRCCSVMMRCCLCGASCWPCWLTRCCRCLGVWGCSPAARPARCGAGGCTRREGCCRVWVMAWDREGEREGRAPMTMAGGLCVTVVRCVCQACDQRVTWPALSR